MNNQVFVLDHPIVNSYSIAIFCISQEYSTISLTEYSNSKKLVLHSPNREKLAELCTQAKNTAMSKPFAVR